MTKPEATLDSSPNSPATVDADAGRLKPSPRSVLALVLGSVLLVAAALKAHPTC